MARKRTQYTSRARSPRNAYGAPAEEREVVVSIDKRLLFGATLFVVFGLAVGISALSASRGTAAVEQSAPATGASGLAQPQPPANPVAQQLASISEEEARSQAKALGLGDNVTIVDPKQYNVPTVSTVVPPEAGDSDADSVIGVMEDMARDPSIPSIDVDSVADEGIREVAENWTSDVLASVADPNVTANEFKAFRVEDISSPLSGPRLGIEGLNTVLTYDFGLVAMNEMARTDLVMKNVGDAPLTISRVYSGCGCTAPRIGDVQIDEAGWLPEPMTLAPGETVDFTVEFDPQLAKEAKAQAKFIQVFSNDDSKEMFDPADPYSHETRFRITVQPTYGEVPSATGGDDS